MLKKGEEGRKEKGENVNNWKEMGQGKGKKINKEEHLNGRLPHTTIIISKYITRDWNLGNSI